MCGEQAVAVAGVSGNHHHALASLSPRNVAHFTGVTRCLQWEMPLHHVLAKSSRAPLFCAWNSHQPQPFLMKTPFILGL